jgi:hypothetical protein
MGNRVDLFIFLAIVAISLLQWIGTQVKERREIKKINERRRAQREGSLAPADGSEESEASLAEARKERLRQLRREQAERMREQVRVMTGQGAPPSGRSGEAAASTAAEAARRAQRGAAGPRRPVRPGRTARRAPQQQTGPQQTAPTAARSTTPSVDVRRDRRPISEPAPPLQTPSRQRSSLGPAFTSIGQSEIGASEKPAGRLSGKNVDWRQAIVLSEIIAPPVGLREDHEF